MLPENPSFVVRGEDGVEYGPVDLDELRDWVQENRAGLGTDVRRDEPGASWQPWQTYPELVALLAEVQVTAATPGQPATSLAPIGRRVLAFALDLILINFLFAPISYLISQLSGIPDLEMRYMSAAFATITHPELSIPPDIFFYGVLSNIASVTILVLYFAGFTAAHGQTPAKAIFRLRVVTADNEKPHFVKALARAMVLALSMDLLFFLPFTYAFFNPQRRALHDVIAGTWVVEA